MTISTFADSTETGAASADYQPGACNIGPAEIARRRVAGHVGLLATVAVLAFLIVIGAPPLTRLIAILPAAASASGYLQAWLRFCAGFGSRGVFNFGPLGEMTTVTDADALARDRWRSRQIGLWALGIGVVVGVLAVLLPV